MKKLLIATAALAMVAGTAQAQSSVSVYGVLSTGYTATDTKFSSDGASRSLDNKSSGAQGQQAGNRIGFRGTEDLGSGLKAGFVYEAGANLDAAFTSNAAGTSMATRLGYIQLESANLGTIRGGRVDGLARQVQNSYTAHGNSGFAPGNIASSYGAFGAAANTLGGGTATNPTDISVLLTAASWGQAGGRISNTIGYISPSFSGFTAQIQLGTVESDDSATANKAKTQDTQNIGVAYNAGKLSLMVAQEKAKAATEAATPATGEATTNTLGASYDFGVAKAFLAYTDRELKASADSTTALEGKIDTKDTTVGVSVPVGAKVVLVASYSDGDSKWSADGDSYKFDVTGYQLQANYLLSKRTKAYVMYGESKAKAPEDQVKLNGYVVGVQHSF
jgi:predicted porin